MSVVGSTQLGPALSCCCFSPDGSEVAVCPYSNQIEIYATSTSYTSVWERLHTLKGHDQLVSGLDWSQRTGLLVSCSHDRNAFVWTRDSSSWQQQMVITRLKRAALCVQWSPEGNKFAIGSSAKVLCVCYYEQSNNWWACKVVRKKHDSSVVSVAWHPNNVFVATASTDMKCRVFNCMVPGVDQPSPAAAASAFGDLLYEIQADPCGWIHSVAWSPDGNHLAFTSHSSCVHVLGGDFIDENAVGRTQAIQTVHLSGLPLKCLIFLSPTTIVGAGWDGSLVAITQVSSTRWESSETGIDLPRLSTTAELSATPTKDSPALNIAARLEMLRSNSAKAPPSPYSPAPAAAGGTIVDGHNNCVVGLLGPFAGSQGEPTVAVTAGLDGRLIFWETAGLTDRFSRLAL